MCTSSRWNADEQVSTRHATVRQLLRNVLLLLEVSFKSYQCIVLPFTATDGQENDQVMAKLLMKCTHLPY